MVLFYYVLCALYFCSAWAESQKSSTPKSDGCDCGPNSYSCKVENDVKVCDCKYKYRPKDGFCQPFCTKDWECSNGARCADESCRCLPGTRGDFCDTVDACEGIKGILMCGDPEEVLCAYDPYSQKPYCSCRIYEYMYYAPERTCKDCNCDKRYGNCSLVEGEKNCTCNSGAALRPDNFYGELKCTPCDCGENSEGCSFQDTSGNGIYWSQVCDCKEGYFQQSTTCSECSCGSHGKCSFEGWYRECDCDKGYKPFLTKDRNKLTCEECNCGKNGVCSFRNEEKQCECHKGYAEKEGKCVACQCYADTKTVDCFFEGKMQHCRCPEGYENGTFFCKDINECLNPKACPYGTRCVNTIGSYECPCKDGYRPVTDDPKDNGCDDINECEDEDMCPRVHTICTNLPGSYTCECERGYEPVLPYQTPAIAGCQPKQPTSSPWKAGVIILCVTFGLCITGLGIAIFLRRRNATLQHSGGTNLHHLRNR